MPVTGAFSGGLRAGSEAVTRGADIAQNAAELQQKKVEAYQKQIEANFKRDSGRLKIDLTNAYLKNDPALIDGVKAEIDAVAKSYQQVGAVFQSLGMSVNPQTYVGALENIKLTATQQEMAKAEADAAKQKKLAETEASGAMWNYTYTDKETNKKVVGSVSRADEEKLKELSEKHNAIFFTGQLSAEDIDKLTPKQQKDLEISADTDVANLNRVANLLNKIKETPGSIGLSGVVTEKVGGAVGQIPFIGDDLEGWVASVSSNASPEQVKQIRSAMVDTVGAMLKSITQEESGRYTDAERNIANEALGNLSKAGSTLDQAVGALKRAVIITTTAARRSNRQAGRTIQDLSTKEGINALGNQIQEATNLDDKSIIEIIKGIREQETITSP